MSFDLYQGITTQIVSMLNKGVIPWRSPILVSGAAGHPQNLESNQPYRGVNVFILAFNAWHKGYSSRYWLTFNQAKGHGASIKKGEKSSTVVYWRQLDVTNADTGEAKQVPMLRYYNVFNVDQCNGLAITESETAEPKLFTPIQSAETLVKNYHDGPAIEHSGGRASYSPLTDSVRLPEPTQFASNEGYYATLFHELAHSTGHSKRLNRGLDGELQPFGSPDYAKEELVAEIAAAYLCGHVGIVPAVIENQAAYIEGWLKRLREDKKLILTAASSGQKAADWICGMRN